MCHNRSVYSGLHRQASTFDLIGSRYEGTAAVFGDVLLQSLPGLFAAAPSAIDNNRIADVSKRRPQCLDHSGELARTLAIHVDQANPLSTFFLNQRHSSAFATPSGFSCGLWSL
jgi:hypothetical protein